MRRGLLRYTGDEPEEPGGAFRREGLLDHGDARQEIVSRLFGPPAPGPGTGLAGDPHTVP
jgi:hypothetical protein